MTRKEAAALKIKDRVIYQEGTPNACTGTVIETGYCQVKIKWDDGELGIWSFSAFREVKRYRGTENIVPIEGAA